MYCHHFGFSEACFSTAMSASTTITSTAVMAITITSTTIVSTVWLPLVPPVNHWQLVTVICQGESYTVWCQCSQKDTKWVYWLSSVPEEAYKEILSPVPEEVYSEIL